MSVTVSSKSPSSVVLAFTEDPDTSLSIVHVVDQNGNNVEKGKARAVPGNADELVEWGRAEMANYKAPRYVELVDELPLNAMGKVLKYELRDRGTKLVTR